MEHDNRVKALMEKYWLAETNEDEEAELRAYFAKHSVPDDDPIAPLFKYFHEERQLTTDSRFDDRFLTAITPRSPFATWLSPLLKVAAVALIAFSTIYILKSGSPVNKNAQKEADTYEDLQKAYEETKKALLLVSQNLNAGNAYVLEIKKIDKAEEIININAYKK